MTKVVYFTACTLDGFIADENDSLDWLFEVPHGSEDEGEEAAWDAFMGDVGALVMGATTYEWMVEHDDMLEHPETWHGFYGDRPAWVFTHRQLPAIPGVDLHFAHGDVASFYDAVVTSAGDQNIWLVGGGDLVGQFDDAGHLDEIQLGMTPVVLGAGAPLLPRRITSSRMRFREAQQTGQRVRIILDVRPPDSRFQHP